MWIKTDIFKNRRIKNFMLPRKVIKEKIEEYKENRAIEFEILFNLYRESFPKDATLLGGCYNFDRAAVLFTVTSSEFDEVEEGEVIPLETLKI